jgi:hypothetical protein
VPRCRATALTSTAACSRRARPNALRRTASSKHSGVGCSHAPRPGIRCRGSGRSMTEDESSASLSVTATTRSRADQLSDPRHPTQVRDGSARSPVRSATDESTASATSAAPRGARTDLPTYAGRPATQARAQSSWALRGRRARPRPHHRGPRRPRCRAGCRCASRSAWPRDGRSGPPCRWRGSAGSRAR